MIRGWIVRHAQVLEDDECEAKSKTETGANGNVLGWFGLSCTSLRTSLHSCEFLGHDTTGALYGRTDRGGTTTLFLIQRLDGWALPRTQRELSKERVLLRKREEEGVS